MRQGEQEDEDERAPNKILRREEFGAPEGGESLSECLRWPGLVSFGCLGDFCGHGFTLSGMDRGCPQPRQARLVGKLSNFRTGKL